MGQSIKPLRYAVLVVEDDPLLLMDALDLVEEAGLQAYGARDAEEAIALMEQHDDIRILFTDVQMPGTMDGLALARAVRGRWPPVTIMVTSGMIKVTKDDMPENGMFFAKPYPPASIVQALNKIVAEIPQ